MKVSHEAAAMRIFWITVWTLLSIAAAFSWGVLFNDIEIWSVLLNPRYSIERNVCAFLAIFALGAPFFWGRFFALKVIVLASDFGFVAALFRGYLSVHFGQDCASFCFGVLNQVLGLGCGSAGEGCAFETYLIAFFVVEFVLLLRYMRLHRCKKAK